MNKREKIVIVLGVVLLISFVAIVFYPSHKDATEQNLLVEELDELEKYFTLDNLNLEAINDIINKNITTGPRVIVEKALEDYITDLANTINSTIIAIDDDRLVNLLTATNYQKDGPNFLESKNYISQTKNMLKQNKTKVMQSASQENIIKYYQSSSLKYKNMYKSLVKDFKINKEEMKNFSLSVDKVINFLDVCDETLTFLSQNANSWNIENNQITFSTTTLLNNYNALIAKVN